MKKNIITKILTLGALLLLSFGTAQAQVYPIQDLNLKGHLQLNGSTGTSGYVVTSGGTGVPTWSSVASSIGANMLALSTLTQQAANTVLGNYTSSTGNVTAFSMPSCSTSGSALTYTSNTGFTCNTSVNASQLGGVAAASYALLASPAFIGTPTAPTQALGDSSTDIATDAFVQNQGLHYTHAGGIGISSNTTITAAQMGGWAQIQTAGVTVTMPTLASTQYGQSMTFEMAAQIGSPLNFPTATLAGNGSENICTQALTCTNTLVINPGEVITLTNNGTGVGWYVTADGVSPLTGFQKLGNSSSLNYNGPVNTTATSTINSTSITVTSATGIVPFQGIYGMTGVPGSCSNSTAAFINNYVVSVVGTTVTMSCAATATESSPVAVQFGQPRYGTSSSLQVNNVGAALAKFGSAAISGSNAGWLNEVSTGQDYSSTSTITATTYPGGGYAATLGARSSDATGGAGAFGLQSILLLDSWGNTTYSSENTYLQDNLYAATAGHGLHIQMEQSINSNWGSPPAEDPYTINVTNQTIAHRYDCGTGQSSNFPNNCTSAVDIVPNGAKFENGIVVANNALDQSNGTAPALSLPLNDEITWYSGSNTYSTAINSPSAGTLSFLSTNNNGFHFYSNSTTQVVSFNASGFFINSDMLISLTAPTINAGFGTGPTIGNNNGTAVFVVTVGSSPGATGTLNMPAAAHGWMCDGVDLSQNNSTQFYLRETANTTTTVTFTMYASSGSASSFVAGDALLFKCFGY